MVPAKDFDNPAPLYIVYSIVCGAPISLILIFMFPYGELTKENFAFYCLPKSVAEKVAAELDQNKLAGEDSVLRKILRKADIS